MKQGKLLFALAALPTVFAGCDVFKPDSLDPPGIRLTGNVAFNGEAVPVRTPSGTTQLRIWHTSWDENDPDRQPTSMGIHLSTDGSYSTMLYPGEYDLQLIDNQGPWVNDTTRIPISVFGDMQVDVPVQPYYTIQDEDIVFTAPAAGEDNGGRITATFRVADHVTSPDVELVGLYVSTSQFVDRGRRETSLWTENPTPDQDEDNPHERERVQIETELANNQPITITLVLPSDIRVTRSPDLRTTLYARVGVKTEGVTELAYSEVIPINIALPQ